jgi:hypothetical protein|nr:MAG TPA: hypothetical protein [Caudoviricetes sp.]
MKAKKLITSESVGIIFAYRFIFRQKKMNLSIYGNTMAQKMNCLVYVLM